jgi:hypothetical protein
MKTGHTIEMACGCGWAIVVPSAEKVLPQFFNFAGPDKTIDLDGLE